MLQNRLVLQPARNLLRAVQPVGRSIQTKPLALRVQLRAMHKPTQALQMRPTARRMMPVPNEEHSAHTISQRLRTLKKIPPELVPLGIVIGIALVAAGYSLIHKLLADKTLRLSRKGPGGDH